MNTNTMILFPFFTFFIEGIMFFNSLTITGSLWYNLMFYSFPMPPNVSWLGVLNYVVYLAYIPIWIGVVFVKLVGTIGVLSSIMSVPFSLMAYYPGLIVIQLPMILLFSLGIIMKIRVMASGLSGGGE